MNRPKAVLFDWDNTLVDTWPMIHQAISATMVHMGHQPWSFEKVKSTAHASARDSFPKIFGEEWPKAYAFFYDYLKNADHSNLMVLDSAVNVLRSLAHHSIPIGVVSNKRADHLRQEINALGWNHFFQSIVGSGDAEKDKPHPEPILEALRLMGLAPSLDVLFIGDTPVDWQASQAAGCFPIAFAPMEDAPVMCVQNHDELLDFLNL
jgi:phosphoglycolate phosphatase